MFLERIVHTKREEVEQLKERTSIDRLETIIADLPPCRGFQRTLAEHRHRDMGLIAEVKKASPSKGLIRADFDPAAIAEAYERAGADCVSVLTDVSYFQGANEFLTLVRDRVQLPLLRKDFTIDPLQIYEARAIGADAILLIAAILTKKQMKEYLRIADDLGMDALVEVHDEQELKQVLEFDLKLIGINNRNLHTFVTDLHTTERLISYIPPHVTVVSESGIASPAEINELYRSGARAVLVGEHFMRQPDVGRAVIDLMGSVR